MKYDSDLIETIYILKKNNPALAERMWNRLTASIAPLAHVQEVLPYNGGELHVHNNFYVPANIVIYMKRTHSRDNKIEAIKDLRMKTGWGLKDSKDAVDFMISLGIIN